MKHKHKPQPIRSELRDWILNTHRAGHDARELVRLMQETGYDASTSRRSVAEVLKLPLAALQPQPPPAGIRPSHPNGPLIEVGGRAIGVSTATDEPVIRVLENLLDENECAQLIELARPRLNRAMTVAEDGKDQLDTRRTSSGAFFTVGETPVIRIIEERLATLLHVPVVHGEGLQVLHYLPGQEYEPHFDWFNPDNAGYAAITARGGQRVASIVMYLNTPEAGGGTRFPEAGLTVAARKGSAVYFAYDTGDQASLHAGLPVERGEKWIVTKWLRLQPFQS